VGISYDLTVSAALGHSEPERLATADFRPTVGCVLTCFKTLLEM
jgi:hypothetical protein